MAETLISPGVFLRENDTSQITQGPITVGAALLGPTVYGPVNIPTLVRSYSDYTAKFGATFTTGGANFEYLTSIAALNYFEQGGESLLVTRIVSGTYTSATANVSASAAGVAPAFTLETLSQGIIMNNDFSASAGIYSGSLPSGSVNNIRWEVAASDSGSGVFTLYIRRGDDSPTNKTVLETWSNLSLDPNENNYIGFVIGDQAVTPVVDTDGSYYLQYTGSYVNQSRYVRVKSVNATPGYLNTAGQVSNPNYTGSMPAVGSGSLNGSFSGAVGTTVTAGAMKLYDAIPSSAGSYSNNIQGVIGADYVIGIGLLQNKDQYDFKTIYAPGLTAQNASSQVSSLLSLAQNRGTCIAVVDMVSYGQNIATAVQQANGFDSSYGATYWPWVQMRSRETGRLFFCPASTIVPAVYEYSDKISAEWFAPAGLTRGGLTTVIQPERRLTVAQRDTLYSGNINPIAIFPGQGTVIYGQKTLQRKPSALDRVNVRRLLIALKRYIGNIAETLLFEQNTQTTRNNFLNQVNPYLQYVQQRQGLYAFRVIMDDTNNTPDVIDRNQLVGQIYLQPTKTAEYILIDFNILPTGATFGV
jgi:phage tail sheath protein FI